MAEAINATQPQTQQMLGEIWTFAEFARAAIHAAETRRVEYGNGVWFPDARAADRVAHQPAALVPAGQRDHPPDLGSHNLFTTPTAAQFADPELRPLLDNLPARRRGDVGAKERARIFRLAWDFAGSALWPAATSSMSASIWVRRRAT